MTTKEQGVKNMKKYVPNLWHQTVMVSHLNCNVPSVYSKRIVHGTHFVLSEKYVPEVENNPL